VASGVDAPLSKCSRVVGRGAQAGAQAESNEYLQSLAPRAVARIFTKPRRGLWRRRSVVVTRIPRLGRSYGSPVINDRTKHAINRFSVRRQTPHLNL
jgi:hypothetical protein